jgi:hypothetical protein
LPVTLLADRAAAFRDDKEGFTLCFGVRDVTLQPVQSREYLSGCNLVRADTPDALMQNKCKDWRHIAAILESLRDR